jgi:cytochrome b involved in lipid metabolism
MKNIFQNVFLKLFVFALIGSAVVTTSMAVKKVTSVYVDARGNRESFWNFRRNGFEDERGDGRRITIKKPLNSDQCIVVLFGKKYDITKLVNTHSGGNIFRCGTDMTSDYRGEHGTDISRVFKYAYVETTGVITKASPTPNIVNNILNLCLITVSGKQYNVTNLVKTHSGGNIFNCGTDMTTTFNGQHGTNLSLISRYLYTQVNGGTTNILPTKALLTANSNGLCLVTISGQKYDVTKLASTHSGGNIFKCGTDMTSIYNVQHGSGLSRMNQYLYNGSAISITGAVQNANNRRGDDDDEREGDDD